jgi:hypothetical protein
MMSNKKIDRYVSARTIYVVIPLYSSIPCVLSRVCRRNLWVKILLSPSYSFSFFFSFSFSFFILFLFFSLFYTNNHRLGLFVILSKYIHMRSCCEWFIKRNPIVQSEFNLVFWFLRYNIFWLVQIMRPTTGCHGLSGAVEVACLHVERTL